MPYKRRWRRRGIALTNHGLGARWGWVANTNLRPLFPEKGLLFILQEAGSASGQVGTGAVSLSRTRTQIPDRQARNQSLYRLRRPGHQSV